jgi:tRNA A-37 threonylcarbamoyl transferase component Bud32
MSTLVTSAGHWIDRVRVNQSTRTQRAGRPIVMKKRRGFVAWPLLSAANIFFRAVENPVRTLVTARDWCAWEIESFLRLHGPEFESGAEADGAVWMHILPGESLEHHLVARTLTPAMLAEAGRELRRAHALPCAFHGAAWSHGDPHTGNFVHDGTRARLIDFEMRHLRGLTEAERHADDLLVLLQDVCGRCAADDWLPLAAGWLEGYAPSPEIRTRLRAKLHVPRGLPRFWWAVRTTWMPRPELERRIGALAELLR